MNDVESIFLILFVFVLGIGFFIWHINRSKSILEQWANQNGYRIQSSEYRLLRRGPFFWTTSRGQTVFYVTLYTQEGATRRAWVRVGGFWLGIFSNKTEVSWDE